MTNNFEKEYEIEKRINKEYTAAEAANDSEKMKSLEMEYKAFEEDMKAKGDNYCCLYNRYLNARERGNDYIDFADPMTSENVAAMVEALREVGVTEFVLSSGWSSANEVAWQFVSNGCALKGMVEINDRTKRFMEDGYDKIHGYLFSVN